MTTLTDLATAMQFRHQVSIEVAEVALKKRIGELLDEGHPVCEGNIGPADAKRLIKWFSAEQRSGRYGTDELATLDDHMERLRELEAQRDPLIRAALTAGARVMDVCEVTGLTRERIRQIRAI